MSTTATLQQQQKAFSDSVQEYIQKLQNDLSSDNQAVRQAALREIEQSLKESGITNRRGNLKRKIVTWE